MPPVTLALRYDPSTNAYVRVVYSASMDRVVPLGGAAKKALAAVTVERQIGTDATGDPIWGQVTGEDERDRVIGSVLSELLLDRFADLDRRLVSVEAHVFKAPEAPVTEEDAEAKAAAEVKVKASRYDHLSAKLDEIARDIEEGGGVVPGLADRVRKLVHP